jgi:hypothetical protein
MNTVRTSKTHTTQAIAYLVWREQLRIVAQHDVRHDTLLGKAGVRAAEKKFGQPFMLIAPRGGKAAYERLMSAH